MKRFRRTGVTVSIVGVLMLLMAPPTLADDGSEPSSVPVAAEADGPAVEIPDEPEPEALADWTYRYLVPTTLVLAALIVLGTSIRYFTNVVRQRYRTVEE